MEYRNKIQLFGIVIIIVGFIAAIICGFAYHTVPADYLANNLANPSSYPIDQAPIVYNWTCAFIVLISSTLCGALFCSLGSIADRQDCIILELKKAQSLPTTPEQPISEKAEDAQSSLNPQSSHKWRDENGNLTSE